MEPEPEITVRELLTRLVQQRPVRGLAVSLVLHALVGLLAFWLAWPSPITYVAKRGDGLFIDLTEFERLPASSPRGSPAVASATRPEVAPPPPRPPAPPSPKPDARAPAKAPAPKSEPKVEAEPPKPPQAPKPVESAPPVAASRPKPEPEPPAPPVVASRPKPEPEPAPPVSEPVAPPPPVVKEPRPESGPSSPAQEARVPAPTPTPGPETPSPPAPPTGQPAAPAPSPPQVASLPPGRGAPPVDIRSALRGRGEIEGDPIPLDSPNPKYSDYLERVRLAIKSKWGFPCVKNDATGECEYKSAHLVVEFAIAKDGRVPFISVLQSSGWMIYDDYAVNAVKFATLPPVPDSLGKKGIMILAKFNYVVDTSLTNLLLR